VTIKITNLLPFRHFSSWCILLLQISSSGTQDLLSCTHGQTNQNYFVLSSFHWPKNKVKT
jgi:hypothetical protein